MPQAVTDIGIEGPLTLLAGFFFFPFRHILERLILEWSMARFPEGTKMNFQKLVQCSGESMGLTDLWLNSCSTTH